MRFTTPNAITGKYNCIIVRSRSAGQTCESLRPLTQAEQNASPTEPAWRGAKDAHSATRHPPHRRRSRKTRIACATFTAVRCPLTGSKGGHLSSFSRHFNRHFSRHFSGHSVGTLVGILVGTLVGILVGTLESKSILCQQDFTPSCDPTAAARAFGIRCAQA